MSTDTAPTPFARNCRVLRKAAGLSLEDATYAIRDHLPRSLWVKSSTIRRLETGFTPESKANPTLLAALAAVYQVPVGKLSKTAADDLVVVRNLAEGTRITSSYPQLRSDLLVHAA